MLSALLNWFELVYGPFGQSNMYHTLDFCSDQLGKHKFKGVFVVEMLMLYSELNLAKNCQSLKFLSITEDQDLVLVLEENLVTQRLSTVCSLYCANFSDFHAMTCGHFWSLSCLGNGKTCKFVKFYLVSKLHCSYFSLGCALLCMCRNKFHEYFLLNLEIESQLILIIIIDSPKTSELFGTLIEIQQILPKNKQKLLPSSSLVGFLYREI